MIAVSAALSAMFSAIWPATVARNCGNDYTLGAPVPAWPRQGVTGNGFCTLFCTRSCTRSA